MFVKIKNNGAAFNGKFKEVKEELQKTTAIYGKDLLLSEYLKIQKSEKTIA